MQVEMTMYLLIILENSKHNENDSIPLPKTKFSENHMDM